jgi:flagellar biosynthesis/type III secretory pathway M-ring protein FliF/YscJ
MKKTKIPSLIPILILTLITIVMWVFLDVFRALKQTPELVVPTEISQPLTPTLDQTSINQIESRTFLNDSQIPNNVANSSPTPGALATPQPENASGSGTTQ